MIMKIVALIWRIFVILFRSVALFFMTAGMLAAVEGQLGYFPLTIGDAFSYVGDIGFWDVVSKCFFTSATGVYISILVCLMPLFFIRLIFFGISYTFMFEWTVETKDLDGHTIIEDATGFMLVVMLVVRFVIAFILFTLAPILMFILIIMNIVKLVREIIDLVG